MSAETLGLSMQQYIQVASLARYYGLDINSLLDKASKLVAIDVSLFDKFLNKTEEENLIIH